MTRKWLLLAALIAALVAIPLAGCTAETTNIAELFRSQVEGIWVSGTGKVTVTPDIATLNLGIEAQETSVAEAQGKASESMDDVRNTLSQNGVADKDIQTRRFSIYQVTRWDQTKQEEVVIGFRVVNMVTAKIRAIDKVGSIIDAVATAGGDLVRISGVVFSVDNPEEYHAEARKKAMDDAKAKAKQLADLAGVTLGHPLYISESAPTTPPIYRAAMPEAVSAPAPAVETSISPGELEITLNVQVAFEIQD